MLHPDPMSEVLVLVRTTDARRAISALADTKLLHLKDHTRTRVSQTTVDIGTPLVEAAELSDTLVKTRTLLAKIDPEAPNTTDGPRTIPERIGRIQALAARYADHERSRDAAAHERELLEKQRDILSQLPNDETPIRALTRPRAAQAILILNPDHTPVAQALGKIPSLGSERNTQQSTLLLTVRSVDAETTIDALKRAGSEIADLSPLQGLEAEGSTRAVTHTVATRLNIAEREEMTTQREIASYATHAGFLRESEQILAFELLKAQAPLRFGQSQQVTIIRGFAPTTRAPRIQEALDTANIDAVMESVTAVGDAPTALNNPRPTRGFEALLSLYALPKYREVDPTSIMAVSFPVFFGFMLGDIGYGACIVILAMYLMRRVPAARRFGEILFVSALSAVTFGIIFGEVFGAEELFGATLPHLLHRTESLPFLFGVAILFGLVHLNLGLVLGIINKRSEGWVFAIIDKGSWIALEVGLGLLLVASGALDAIPALADNTISLVPGTLVTALAIIGIAYSSGIQGVLEMPMIITHTLSYLRLAAIGLSSVTLAAVTNAIGGGLVKGGGMGIVWGILILLFGHTLNLALGLLGPFIHSLRLHYVEFFMKFYEGGGQAYRPFGAEATV